MGHTAEIVEVGGSPAGTSFNNMLGATPSRISASRLPLDTIESARREMARVYREMRSGTLPTQVGTRLVYTLTELSKLLVLGQMERRIAALENDTGMMIGTDENPFTMDDRNGIEQPA